MNLRLRPSTVQNTVERVSKFLRWSKGEVSPQTVSGYLKQYLGRAPATYNGELKALRRFSKFLNRPELLASFKMAPVDYLPREGLTREQVRLGCQAQPSTLTRAIYLFIASSGLRKGEVLSLRRDQIDLETRAMKANHFTRSKRSGVTFFNRETEVYLRKYLEEREDDDPRLFLISDRQFRQVWRRASEAAGVKITPQILRIWFSTEMGERGVPDRYIDIFQGRAPRTVIAKHYTGIEFERLKRIYDKANLTILNDESSGAPLREAASA